MDLWVRKNIAFWTATVLFWIACSEVVSATPLSAWSGCRGGESNWSDLKYEEK